jgi:GrpB-like predicted nucleotidyltransferase (UPF0157 family)
MGRPIATYRHSPVECLDYDSRAPEVVTRVAPLIIEGLPGVAVEHIGSTAVPGCRGKGVIDVMALYPAAALQSVKDRLEVLGFQRQTTRDPFPEDRPMRLGAIDYEGATFRLHVHVISLASPEAGEMRMFRDCLRADPVLREAYVARKRAILEAGTKDPVEYAEAKAPFVASVLKGEKIEIARSEVR